MGSRHGALVPALGHPAVEFCRSSSAFAPVRVCRRYEKGTSLRARRRSRPPPVPAWRGRIRRTGGRSRAGMSAASDRPDARPRGIDCPSWISSETNEWRRSYARAVCGPTASLAARNVPWVQRFHCPSVRVPSRDSPGNTIVPGRQRSSRKATVLPGTRGVSLHGNGRLWSQLDGASVLRPRRARPARDRDVRFQWGSETLGVHRARTGLRLSRGLRGGRRVLLAVDVPLYHAERRVNCNSIQGFPNPNVAGSRPVVRLRSKQARTGSIEVARFRSRGLLGSALPLLRGLRRVGRRLRCPAHLRRSPCRGCGHAR
jgi:hypothetical protein